MELCRNVAILWLPLMAQGIIPMKKFALIALPLSLGLIACEQKTEETTVETAATEPAMAEPMAADTAAPMADDTAAAPMADDAAAPMADATPAATETPAQ